jgi:CspA family cold shock protein
MIMDTTTEIRLTGVVKWFDSDRGFGFINANGEDYFAHVTNVAGDFEIMEKDEVSFTVATGKNGRRKAVNIRILSK